MQGQQKTESAEIWVDRFHRNSREIFLNTLISGVAIFLVSYGGLFLTIRLIPNFFINYISPVFNSDGSRDAYFYMHPFILALSLSVFWNRFRKYFEGNIIKVGIEFGLVYAFIALVPILWITFAAMEVDLQMIITWLLYGFMQSSVGGIVFSYLRSRNT